MSNKKPGVAGKTEESNPPNFVEDITKRVKALEDECKRVSEVLLEFGQMILENTKQDEVDEALDFLVEGHLAEDVEKFEKLIKDEIRISDCTIEELAKAEALQPDLEYKICYYCEWIEYRWCKSKKEIVNATDTCDNFNPMSIARFTNEVEKDAS